MTAPLRAWVRVKPSGHVHLVVGVSTSGLRMFACGARYHRNAVTAEYPPAAHRCIDCEDAAGEPDDWDPEDA
jgi:hypothetical protein